MGSTVRSRLRDKEAKYNAKLERRSVRICRKLEQSLDERMGQGTMPSKNHARFLPARTPERQ